MKKLLSVTTTSWEIEKLVSLYKIESKERFCGMSAIIGSEEIIIQLTPHICIIKGIFYQRGRRGLSVSLSDKKSWRCGVTSWRVRILCFLSALARFCFKTLRNAKSKMILDNAKFLTLKIQIKNLQRNEFQREEEQRKTQSL